MLGTHDLLLFVLSALLLNITPGQDTLYIVSRSASQGWLAGAIAALGIGAGCIVHITAAAFGLSAVLAASASAFTLLKLAGAAYLIYIGVSLLRSGHAAAAASLPPSALRSIFVQGFWTNVLNPKVALFFLAFLPQFVDAGAAGSPLPFLFLGLVFNVNGTLWNLFVAWSAAQVGHALHSTAALWFNRGVGALFVYLGARLALTEK